MKSKELRVKSYGRKAVFQSCFGNAEQTEGVFQDAHAVGIEGKQGFGERVDDEIKRVGEVLKEKQEPRLSGF